jgi:sugar/nucleoside kinase (ribokinase family)
VSLLVVGSIAYDSIETPYDKIDNALGGSAVYVSIAASYYSQPVSVVGVVGGDFKQEHIDILKNHNVDLGGLKIVKDAETFRWAGKYHDDMNNRDSLSTELNVFAEFNPVIPEQYRRSEYLLLGNIDPVLQLRVLDQLDNPAFIVLDTMDFWIKGKKTELMEVLKKVDMVIINDSEAKLLAEEPNLIKAAARIMQMGPKYLVIKKGEHGALLFNGDKIFSAAAYPLSEVFDPTGAGDTFAGGLVGYLHKTRDLSFENMKKAVISGSTMASFCVQKFSTKGLENLDAQQIDKRYNEFIELTKIND